MPRLCLRRDLHVHSLHLRDQEVDSKKWRAERPPLEGPEMAKALSSLLEERQRFLRFLEPRVGDHGVAEDILQAAYMRALEHEGELGEQESVVGWFYRVLRNAVIDEYRRNSRHDTALGEWGRELERSGAQDKGLEDNICSCLRGVIDGMQPSYARLLQEVELGEQPLTEFAQRERISAGNAAVRAHRARAALRKRLEETCGMCSAHGCLNCSCGTERGRV